MFSSSTLLFVLLLLGPSNAASAVHWGYSGEVDPEHWADYYTTCSGTRQSPINIDTQDVIYNNSLKDFTFTNFDNRDSSLQWTLNNNGHTAIVTVSNEIMTVTGGGLDGPYQVAQFHFHWGDNSSQGSEHEIDKKTYPMELHIVSYKVAYDNVTNAQNYGDGLAVLGFFFEIVEKEHETFAKLVSMLPEIHEENAPFAIDVFSLAALLPKDTSKYYRYLGSLTTPPCSEVVVWTVFRETIKVSESQIAEFRNLTTGELSNETLHLEDNFRPVQPLHGRPVMASFPQVPVLVENTTAHPLTNAETTGEQPSTMETTTTIKPVTDAETTGEQPSTMETTTTTQPVTDAETTGAQPAAIATTPGSSCRLAYSAGLIFLVQLFVLLHQ